MQRLGRLFSTSLFAGFITTFITAFITAFATATLGSVAQALPVEPKKLASELKMTPQTVRVKLSNLGRVMVIKGTDLALSLAKKPELGNVRADQWMIDCKRSKIIDPSSGKSRVIPRSGVLIEGRTGILAINEKRFRDQIVVYPRELVSPYDAKMRSNPECVVVNHIHIEKYLESVVNAEFNSRWASEAVEAQIIAARTYALYQMKQMRRDRGRVFDVESTQKDQVYLGMDSVDSKAAELVAKTQGMIMVAKKDKHQDPIKAFYHASCGGYTALPERVWGAKFAGFTRRVPCPYCAGSPSFTWQHELTLFEISEKLRKGIRSDQANRKVWPKRLIDRWSQYRLTDVKPVGGNFPDNLRSRLREEGSSGHVHLSLLPSAQAAATQEPRIRDLRFEFTARESKGAKASEKIVVQMDAYQARNWLDPARLKSTWFSLQRVGNLLRFRGLGAGHGVGMCQWGAKKMGEKGFTREQILSHYYPGIKIARIW